jgi:3-dehydroquinate synthase
VVVPAAGDRFHAIEVLGYEVVVGAGLIDRLGEIAVRVAPAHRYALVSDDQVAAHWMARAAQSFTQAGAATIATTVPAGESSKSRAQWASLTDWLLEHGAGRDTTIIALGGGVIGDLAGFVAATYLRGVPVIQVPTSLLAMVDASVGGKTGVDTPAGKNLVGAFHQPAAVVIDPATLATLPAAHRRAGIAEVLKHGAISDASFFRLASTWGHTVEMAADEGRDFDWSGPQTLGVVSRSVAIKASVVRADPMERGLRQVLNAGHTVAHALERETGYVMLHGEAVAIGLVTEALLGERAGVTAAGTATALRDALGGAGLPTRIPAGIDAARLVDAMRQDKKSRGGSLAFALLDQIGAMAGSDDAGWATALGEQVVRSVLAEQAAEGA